LHNVYIYISIIRKNCFLKHFVEGNMEGRIEVRGRRGRSCKQLLDDLKEAKVYCKLNRKYYIALCGELVLQEAVILSLDGVRNVRITTR
jgi:hypothetical protein